MPKWLLRFLMVNRVGRGLTIAIHRWPLHPGAGRHPLRFSSGGCFLCRAVAYEMYRHYSDQGFMDDQSTVLVSEPVYAEDGTLIKRGISMSATAKRQLDALMTDPERAAAVQKAIDAIATDPDAHTPR